MEDVHITLHCKFHLPFLFKTFSIYLGGSVLFSVNSFKAPFTSITNFITGLSWIVRDKIDVPVTQQYIMPPLHEI